MVKTEVFTTPSFPFTLSKNVLDFVNPHLVAVSQEISGGNGVEFAEYLEETGVLDECLGIFVD